MKVTYIETINGNFRFDVDGTIITLWNVCYKGGSVIALKDFGESFRFNKVMFKDNVESITEFIYKHNEFVKNFISKAIKEQELKDTYRKLPIKQLVSRNDDTVMITKIDCSRGYVSITASIVRPQSESVLEEQCRDMWTEHFMDSEKLSEKEALKRVNDLLRMEGVQALADCSLFHHSFTYNKEEYFFESESCGCLHENIKAAYPKDKTLRKLIKMHLNNEVDMTEALWLFSQIEECDDVVNEVIRLGKEIITSKIPTEDETD